MSHAGLVGRGGDSRNGGFGDVIGPIIGDVIGDVIGRVGRGRRPNGTNGQFPDLPGLPQPDIGMGEPPPDFRGGVTACGNKAMSPTMAANGVLCCPSGWHLSTAKDKCTGVTTTCCVRNRRMNPLNPRALTRSTRRLTAFNRIIKKTQAQLDKLARPKRRSQQRAPAPCPPTCK